MIIPVITVACLPVKARIWCHIYLAAYDRIDIICLCRLIKLHHTVHIAMVCDCGRVHAKLLDALYIFFYLV